MEKKGMQSFPVNIRFSDLDAMGHVNNAVYFTYFEEGRKLLFLSSIRKDEKATFDFILAKSICDYKLPLLLEDQALLDIWIGDVGTKSFTFKYRIRGKNDPTRVFAEGETVMVSYDYKAGRSKTIPEETREKLLSLMI